MTPEVCRETSTPFPRKTRTTEAQQAGASGTRDGGETTLQTHGPPTPISSGCRSTASRQNPLPSFRTIGASPPANSAPVTSSGSCSYRPLHVTPRRPTSADYNTFIQNRAAAGHTDVQAYSNGFKVVGCTEDDDARDNTGTTFTGSDKGVPIYWLGGTKIADQYQDLLRRLLGQRVQYPRQRRVGRQQHQHQPPWPIALGPAA